MPEPSRPKQQRAAANARYNHRLTTAGLVKLNVLVPLVNLEELDRLLVTWRQEAKKTLESDLPTADQILLVHATCRALRMRLPVLAFATRLAADEWLREKTPLLGDREAVLPSRRSVE